MLAIGSLLLLLLLAGCGGDGDATSTEAEEPAPSGPLSKPAYEAAFRTLKADLDQTPDPLAELREDSSAEEASAGFRDIAEYTRAAAAELDALEPPANIADEHQGFVEVVEGLADGSDQIAALIDEDGLESAAETLQDPAALAGILTTPELEEKRKAFVEAVAKGDYNLGLTAKELKPFEPEDEEDGKQGDPKSAKEPNGTAAGDKEKGSGG